MDISRLTSICQNDSGVTLLFSYSKDKGQYREGLTLYPGDSVRQVVKELRDLADRLDMKKEETVMDWDLEIKQIIMDLLDREYEEYFRHGQFHVETKMVDNKLIISVSNIESNESKDFKVILKEIVPGGRMRDHRVNYNVREAATKKDFVSSWQ